MRASRAWLAFAAMLAVGTVVQAATVGGQQRSGRLTPLDLQQQHEQQWQQPMMVESLSEQQVSWVQGSKGKYAGRHACESRVAVQSAACISRLVTCHPLPLLTRFHLSPLFAVSS